MNDEQIRQLVRQEIRNAQGQGAFNINQVPFHTHTGTGADAPRIPASSVIPGYRAAGTITMSTDQQTYTLGLNFNASELQFHGIAFRGGGGNANQRAIITGNAQLGTTFYFQGVNSNSVTAGGPILDVVQGCSSLVINTEIDPEAAAATAVQGFIAYVALSDPDNPEASAQVIGYGTGYVKVKVSLDSGWSIRGYFVAK